MKKATYKGHTILHCDSMAETPIDRFVMHNFFLSVDAGLGSDTGDYFANIDNMITMCDKRDYEKLRVTLINQKQMMMMIEAKQHPKLMSFMPLIVEVDGKRKEDYSEEGCKATMHELGKLGFTYGTIIYLIDDVKKKCLRKLLSIFQTWPKVQRSPIST